MDDTLCRQFFCAPEGAMHQRYEALRAFFVEHRLLRDIARDFRFPYGSLRNLVCVFRRQCRDDTVSPFLAIPPVDDRASAPARRQRRFPRSPIAGNSP